MIAPTKIKDVNDESPEIKRLDTRQMDIGKARSGLANINWQL